VLVHGNVKQNSAKINFEVMDLCIDESCSGFDLKYICTVLLNSAAEIAF
jgi:hypothetical protein